MRKFRLIIYCKCSQWGLRVKPHNFTRVDFVNPQEVMTTITTTHQSIMVFLQDKSKPVSARKIAITLKMKKRAVLAVCHQEPKIMKVHPSHCGWGKEEASLFIISDDEKWMNVKCLG